MRVAIIGGTGHIGTYLVPRLVGLGHEVISITRDNSKPYRPHGAWKAVRKLKLDRHQEDKAGTFGQKVRDLKPDVVIDMICYSLDSAKQLVEALDTHVQQFLHCGTIWVHGYSVEIPTTEDQHRSPIGDYGIQKNAIEAYLLEQARRRGFPATVLHPGQIVGPGWAPVSPAGNLSTDSFAKLIRGEELTLPNLGMETIHPVHADDIAQAFVKAMTHWSNAVGESFHVVSPAALTLRGYAEAVASWFGKEARLSFLPLQEWRKTVDEADASLTENHISHSQNCSIAKARRLLEYSPAYTSLQAVYESLTWLIEHGQMGKNLT